MSFDPDALKQKSNYERPKSVKPVRLFLNVTHYDLPDNGAHYAVGHNFDNPEQQIRVRLTTIDERIKERPKQDPDKIRSMYVSGENTRDTLAAKSKAGITLLALDDAMLISDAGGISEYRAHWPQTISTSSDAEIISGMGHIRLREAGENQKSAQAFVELIDDAKVVDGSNIRNFLTEAVEITDDKNRGRDPFAIVRIEYNGQIYGTARLYPATGTKSIYDQNLGSNKDVAVKLDGKSTMAAIMSGNVVGAAGGYVDQQADVIRALVAGLEGDENPPVFNDASSQARNANIFYGAKAGQLVIQVLPAQKIEFGSDSRKTYLNDKFVKRRYQLQGYDLPGGGEQDGKHVSVKNGYTPTVVGIQRHPDGTPYAVYASPKETYPVQVPLNDLSVAVLAKPEPVELVLPTDPESKNNYSDELSSPAPMAI